MVSLSGRSGCTAVDLQYYPTIASDDAGGAIVTWYDFRSGVGDIYAQRVSAAGVPQWAANGVALCVAPSYQYSPTIAVDGSGGAIITWYDLRSGSLDIYAQRVNAAGVPQWTANGVALCTAPNDQQNATIVPDGAGGAIVAWQDLRNGANYDIYAQRIDSYGYLGNAEPISAGIRDVLNDQGGKVKVNWTASYLDGASYALIDSYWILRSAPSSAVALARAAGAHVTRDLSVEPARGVRTFLALPDQAADYAWEYVGSNPAFHVSTYSFVAPTTTDSTGAANPRTPFMIMARTAGGAQWWFSTPDSGYSVDNLAPATPAPFTGAYSGGATHLHWGQNYEADLAGYRLYRGTSASFVPGPANLIAAQPITGFDDVGPLGRYYKLSAVDIHGNESAYAVLGPDGTLDVPGVPALTPLAFAAPTPNPVRSEGATFRFALPAEARVRITLFDQQGRRVRDLAQSIFPAGAHSMRWDGRDDAGHEAASGIYFARLEAMGRLLQARFALVR